MEILTQSVRKWFSADASYQESDREGKQIDWLRTIPFLLINLSSLLVFVVGFSWVAFLTALVLYYVRMYGITGVYHRYFSHKTYQMNRFWQFIFGLIAASAVQRGPLWWAAHHRDHHLYSDEPEDAHSPVQHGFWWSHMGWIMSKKYYNYNPERIRDFAKFPEIRFLDRYDTLVPAFLFVSLFSAGWLMQHYAPSMGTSGWQMLVWGFCLSTTALYHTTFFINSLTHIFGNRRFATKDNSRNSWWLAILTIGEGWHNNHHHYPATARQGFYWWEIDITYYILKLFEKLHIVKEVRGLPKAVLEKNLEKAAS